MEFFPAVKLQNSHTDQTHGDGQAAEIPHFWRPAFNFERTYFLFFFFFLRVNGRKTNSLSSLKTLLAAFVRQV